MAIVSISFLSSFYPGTIISDQHDFTSVYPQLKIPFCLEDDSDASEIIEFQGSGDKSECIQVWTLLWCIASVTEYYYARLKFRFF